MLLAATCTVSLSAQGRGRGGGGFGMGGGSGLQLVTNEAVQKELGISEEQVAKITSINEKIRQEVQAGQAGGVNFQDLQQLSEEERAKRMAEIRAQMTEASKKINEKLKPQLAEVLDSQQMERLNQIVWQVAGSQALLDPALASALKLNKEQQEKLTAISKEFADKQQELFAAGAGGDFQERFARMRELNEARDKQAIDVLTADQREQYEKLKGKPFDVAQLRGGSRGLGGAGGPGGAGGGPGGRGGPGRPQRPGGKSDGNKQ